MQHSRALKNRFIQGGAFISLVGIPGCGKSTLTRALGERMTAEVLFEPEESEWPIRSGEKWQDCVFRLENWLSDTMRLQFVAARQMANGGATVIVDSALFLLTKKLTDPVFDWWYGHLTAEQHEKIMRIAEMDWEKGPFPDLLVMIHAGENIWREFLGKRGRSMDDDKLFLSEHLRMQALLCEAAADFAREKNITLIHYEQQLLSPDKNARRLLAAISAIT